MATKTDTKKLTRRAFAVGAAGSLATGVTPAIATAPRMRGINLAGLEFNNERTPGRVNTDYIVPTDAELAYYASCGATLARVPFLWERLQPEFGGAFDRSYLASLSLLVDQCAARGMSIILEAHQFGRRRIEGRSVIIGESAEAPSAAFAEFWGRLAVRFKERGHVSFGLMNEPHDQDTARLMSTQNAAIAAIRAAGARQLILASGNAWSGAHSWRSSGNAEAALDIRDPLNNFAFDVHQYLDADSSGTHTICANEPPAARLAAFTQWARTHRRRGFLGEFGAGRNAPCTAALSALLDDINANGDVWLGWAYWAGGPWWGEDYEFSIEPAALAAPRDRAQMRILRAHF